MSNPILCYIIPKCGLDIKVKGVNVPDHSGHSCGINISGSDPTDYSGPREYEIKNLHLVNGLTQTGSNVDKGHVQGIMSPLSRLSLSLYSRDIAGIPHEAKYYAFAHPPPKLSDLFGDYEDVLNELRDKERLLAQDERSDNEGLQSWSLAKRSFFLRESLKENDETPSSPPDTMSEATTTGIFAKFGAFCYFSEDEKIIAVNVVSFRKTKYQLRLAGPLRVTKTASEELIASGRVIENKISQHNECGFIGMSWIRPHENFSGQPASTQIPCNHGGVIFYKDNGDSVIYAIQNQYELHESRKGFNLIADANECLREQTKVKFFPKRIRLNDLIECRKRVNAALKDCGEGSDKDDIDLEKMSQRSLQDKFPILHQALKCKFKLSDIKKIAEKYKELNQTDMYGWQAIHYGARFYARDEKVIKYLLDQSDENILMQTDGLNRYPLHIACDSNPTEEVIRLLMGRKHGGDGILYKKTDYLRLLPIHIACNGGASKEVIKALLEADKRKETILAKTAVGRLPLHIALLNKMSYEIIEILLDAESDLEHILPSQYGIYQWDHGMLPIHIVCLNEGLDSEILKLLVDRDSDGRTLFQRLRQRDNRDRTYDEFNDESDHNALLNSSDQDGIPIIGTDAVTNEDEGDHRYLDADAAILSGMRSLHLCLLIKSTDSCRLILQAEKRHSHKDGTKSASIQQRAKMTDDHTRRTCLHWACMNNCESDIVNLLLVLDPKREASKMPDKDGCTPLHLACNQKEAKTDIIGALLDTELSKGGNENDKIFGRKSYYYKSQRHLENGKRRSWPWTKTEQHPSETLDRLGRNPLSLAVKSSVSSEVLELMLMPAHFDTNGFDDRTINQLAIRIKKNTKLQKSLTRTLAARIPFFIFYMQLMAWSFGVFASLYGTNSRFLNSGEKEEWVVCLMSIVAAVFISRELVQICSERWNYIFDRQNIFEMTNLFLFILSINIFQQETIDKKDWCTNAVLLGSSCLLIINSIFFLRSTFLPFSRFAGGLMNIFSVLVPFFAVSILLLLMFTFIYRFENTYNSKGVENDESSLVNQCDGKLIKCFSAVLGAFFGGGTEGINNVPDFLFGLLIVLVLLNVVIAIVSDAWEDAKDHATILFWKGRLNFLLESRSAIMFASKQNDLFKWVDRMPIISIKPSNISWTRDHPYCLVKKREQYDNPKYYFSLEIAEQINAVKSQSTDFYWLKRDGEKNDKATYEYMLTSLKWIGRFLSNLLFLVLGLLLGGILWTTDQRVWILSFGKGEDGHEDLKEVLENEKKKCEDLQAEVKRLQNEVKRLKASRQSD